MVSFNKIAVIISVCFISVLYQPITGPNKEKEKTKISEFDEESGMAYIQNPLTRDEDDTFSEQEEKRNDILQKAKVLKLIFEAADKKKAETEKKKRVPTSTPTHPSKNLMTIEEEIEDFTQKSTGQKQKGVVFGEIEEIPEIEKPKYVKGKGRMHE